MQKQYLYQLEKLGIVDNFSSKAFIEFHHVLFIKANRDGDSHESELFPLQYSLDIMNIGNENG